MGEWGTGMENSEVDRIIADIWRDRERIFDKNNSKKFQAYDHTQSWLHKTNVATDPEYQRNQNRLLMAMAPSRRQ